MKKPLCETCIHRRDVDIAGQMEWWCDDRERAPGHSVFQCCGYQNPESLCLTCPHYRADLFNGHIGRRCESPGHKHKIHQWPVTFCSGHPHAHEFTEPPKARYTQIEFGKTPFPVVWESFSLDERSSAMQVFDYKVLELSDDLPDAKVTAIRDSGEIVAATQEQAKQKVLLRLAVKPEEVDRLEVRVVPFGGGR